MAEIIMLIIVSPFLIGLIALPICLCVYLIKKGKK